MSKSAVTDLNSLTSALSSVSVSSTATDKSSQSQFIIHSHPSTDSAKAWVETLSKSTPPSGVKSSILTKTLVLKTKGAKPLDVPLLVFARENAEFSINSLAKSLGAKEARVATDDLVVSTLKVSKIDGNNIFLSFFYLSPSLIQY